MTYDKSWTFQNNTVPTDQSTATKLKQSWLYQLKTFLVSAAGWTVAQSCDSSTYGSSDLWTGLSSIIGDYEPNAHSWIVLKSPIGIVAGADGSYTGDQSRLWFVMSSGNTSATPQGFKFSVHREAPTGGNTTTTPTSTDQIVFLGGSASYIPSGNCHFHFSCTSAGNFYAALSKDSSSYFAVIYGLLPFSDIQQNGSSLDYPYAVSVCNGWNSFTYTSSPGAIQSQFMRYRSDGQGIMQGWSADGTTTQANQTFNCLGNGSPDQSVYTGGWIGYGFPSGGDSVNSVQLYGQIHVTTTSGGKTAYIGRLADFFGSGAGTPQLSVDSVSTPTIQFFGNLWIPTNVVMSL